MLTLAELDLAAGQFARARSRAEALLEPGVPPAVRSAALLVAADASYALGAYEAAEQRYEEFVSTHAVAPEAPRARLALGWARLRQGRHNEAVVTWIDLARRFPEDARTPLALLLAAEVRSRAGDTATARALLDRVLAEHSASADARIAILSRSLLALQEHREPDALRDLRDLVRSSQPQVVHEHRRLLRALASPGGETNLEGSRLLENGSMTGLVLADASGESDQPAAAVPDRLPLERFATVSLEGERDPEHASRILHGLVLLATEHKLWPAADRIAGRLVDAFPSYPAAPDLLARLAARAAVDQQWLVARTAYARLVTRYPETELSGRARVDFADALFRTGAAAEARATLERFVNDGQGQEQRPRALLLLARVNEALGDPVRAIAAYDRLRRHHPDVPWTAPSLLAHARLLQDVGRPAQARPLLERAVTGAAGDELGEAAYRLAAIQAAEGQHTSAVEWYMTAAYSARGSRWERLALLGAGRSLAALGETREALILYGKLLQASAPGTKPGVKEAEHRETTSEAAYRAAEILRGAGLHRDALDMYLTTARLTPEAPRGHRALVGAVQSLVATGDRAAADRIYQRLVQSGTAEPALVAEASRALRAPAGSRPASR